MADELAAFARAAENLQLTVVVQQYMLDDGQPQAGAPGFLVTTGVGPIETFGQAGNMYRIDTDAAVPDRQVRPFPVGIPANFNFATGRSVFDRIENQVGEGTA